MRGAYMAPDQEQTHTGTYMARPRGVLSGIQASISGHIKTYLAGDMSNQNYIGLDSSGKVPGTFFAFTESPSQLPNEI